MKTPIKTNRTYLRELTVHDAENFYNLNLDPDVLKYTGDNPFGSIEEAKKFLLSYDQYKKFGMGRLAVIETKTNEFIGWCGLKYTADKDEYDIGFRFFKKHWNRGFATETSEKILEIGFTTLNLEKIIGRAMKENCASIKVLEKIGMQFERNFDFDGHEGVIYELTNNRR